MPTTRSRPSSERSLEGAPTGDPTVLRMVRAMRIFRAPARETTAEDRQTAWLEVAMATLEEIGSYRCPAIPVRPVELLEDDEDLAALLRRLARGGRKSKDEKRTLAVFGAWRSGVWAVEEAARGNVIALAHAWITLYALPEDARERTGCRAIRALLEAEYHLPPDEPMPRDRCEVDRWSGRVCRRRVAGVLPGCLAEFHD